MIPASLVFLDAMPLTENGKVERARRCRAPDTSRPELEVRFQPPLTGVTGHTRRHLVLGPGDRRAWDCRTTSST